MARFTYTIEGQVRKFDIPDEIYRSVFQKWETFKKDIVYRNRYFSSANIIQILSSLNFMSIFPAGTHLTFYRARIGDFQQKPDSEMMAPPPNKISGGRCNPEGISYLYLANTKETAIREIKPQIGDIVTVASFDVDMSNVFSFNVYLMKHYGISAGNDYALCLLLLILEDLSSAVTKSNHLDYIPLQYISEYIKSKGYDAFSYSSVYNTGMNLVVFDWKDKVTLISKELVKVKNTCVIYE